MANYLQGEFSSEGLFAYQLSGVLYAKPANLVDMPYALMYVPHDKRPDTSGLKLIHNLVSLYQSKVGE